MPDLPSTTQAFLPKTSFPGDVRLPLARMVRVNLAGEESAVAIYKGQLQALAKTPAAPDIQDMLQHEQEHAEAFVHWMGKLHARPSLFGFFWRTAGYGLGFLAGKLGTSYAMAQTEAVEKVIEIHYGEQISQIAPGPFRALLEKCQAEEAHHKEVGAAQHTSGLLLDSWMRLTSLGTMLAVRIAERV